MFWQPSDRPQIFEDLALVAVPIHGNKKWFETNSTRVDVFCRLLWCFAGRISRVKHVVDIRALQQFVECLTSPSIRDPELHPVFQNEKFIVITIDLVWVGACKPGQIFVYVAWRCSVRFFCAAGDSLKPDRDD